MRFHIFTIETGKLNILTLYTDARQLNITYLHQIKLNDKSQLNLSPNLILNVTIIRSTLNNMEITNMQLHSQWT